MLYALIIYFSVGLRRELGALIWYLLLSLTTVFAGQSLGLLVSIVLPDLALANCLSFVFVLLIMLFGGFYVNVQRIPAWCAWLRYDSFMYWAFSGMVINEFAGRTIACGGADDPYAHGGCPVPGERVISEMGYSAGSVSGSYCAVLGMGVLFRTAAYLCLRFNLTVRV